jgi:D-sedoheptulose 7-phosphate isomerase
VGTLDDRFNELANLIPVFRRHAEESITAAAEVITQAFANSKKVLICGNGGSAADSQHFAAEFVNAFSRDLDRRALPAIALSTDTSILTSIANDFQFDNVFSRQVEAYGQSGDVLIALTTSGSSRNCLNAIKVGHSRGLKTISFTKEGSQISRLAQISIEVPSENTQNIQECHILAYHVITELVEDDLFRMGAKL